MRSREVCLRIGTHSFAWHPGVLLVAHYAPLSELFQGRRWPPSISPSIVNMNGCAKDIEDDQIPSITL